MRRQLSRRQSLSLGFLGVVGAWSCTGSVDGPGGSAGGAGGGDIDASGGSAGSSKAGAAGAGGSSGGTGGSTGGSGGSTGGSGGSTGGSGGSGGATGGSGGTGGSTGGAGGTGGSTGGSAGSGGSTGGSSGAGGSGGASGAGGAGGGKDGGSSGDSGGAGCSMAMITALISGNHGHALAIPMADIMAGAQKTYNARGTAAHDHFVQVTAADFTALKSGGTVIKRSCNGGDHEYVLSCAMPTRQPTAPTCSDECGLTEATLCPP